MQQNQIDFYKNPAKVDPLQIDVQNERSQGLSS